MADIPRAGFGRSFGFPFVSWRPGPSIKRCTGIDRRFPTRPRPFTRAWLRMATTQLIDCFYYRPYRLPLRQPWRTSHGVWRVRRGWLLFLGLDDHLGYGDCAPLPAAGTESFNAAAAALKQWQKRIVGQSPERALANLSLGPSQTPATHYGIETALLDALARRDQLPLRLLFDANAKDRIAVNAALGAATTVTTTEIATALARGEHILKLKVGIAEPHLEHHRLATLAKHLPSHGRFRLDANQAWDERTATSIITRLNNLPIESLEEPLRQPTPRALARLQELAGFPLGLDETLAGGKWLTDLTCYPVQRLVLKPAVQGGLRRCLKLAQTAQQHGLETVLTSIVESAAGLWPTAQLAAALPNHLAHGLATHIWFTETIGAPPPIVNGHWCLGKESGSGFNERMLRTAC